MFVQIRIICKDADTDLMHNDGEKENNYSRPARGLGLEVSITKSFFPSIVAET